jgi:hypothetical protein
MGVSKQDWKDFQTKVWLGEVKSTYDLLIQAFDGILSAIDGEDANEFITQASEGSPFREAAIAADQAASGATRAANGLRLAGGQRRFANQHAITISDGGVDAVGQYLMATDLLSTGLVRGLTLQLEDVQSDPAKMAEIKASDLALKLRQERRRVQDCFEYGSRLVAAMADIDKIGVV